MRQSADSLARSLGCALTVGRMEQRLSLGVQDENLGCVWQSADALAKFLGPASGLFHLGPVCYLEDTAGSRWASVVMHAGPACSCLGL